MSSTTTTDLVYEPDRMELKWVNDSDQDGLVGLDEAVVLRDNVVHPCAGHVVVRDEFGNTVSPDMFEHGKHRLVWIPKPTSDWAVDEAVVVANLSSVARGKVILTKKRKREEEGGVEDVSVGNEDGNGPEVRQVEAPKPQQESCGGGGSACPSVSKELFVKGRGIVKRAHMNKVLQACLKDITEKVGIQGYGVHNQPCGLQKMCYNTSDGVRKIFPTQASCLEHLLTTFAIDVVSDLAQDQCANYPSVMDASICPDVMFHS